MGIEMGMGIELTGMRKMGILFSKCELGIHSQPSDSREIYNNLPIEFQ